MPVPVASRQFSPAQLLAFSIAGLIAAGTLLLWLPISAAREPLSLVDAFFTSTSAVCVTGLIVVDTPVDLSTFGQLVVLLLIQIGGLGYMSITTVVAVALGKTLTMHERLTLQEALNVQTKEGLVRFVFSVFKLTLVFELVGAAVLTARWLGEMGAPRAMYYALFHSVSAFNNAGFALFSDSLMGFRGDRLVNLVVIGLLVAGGIGFVVLTELGAWRRTRRLSVHTSLVLGMTSALIVLATVVILVLESGNPRTLAGLEPGERLLAALFQAITPRTAGFNTLDIGAMTPASQFFLMILMFIGAAPGGTGGGVKITTFAITVAALWATVRGMEEASIFKRRLAPALVARAFFIALIAFLALNGVAALLLVIEGRELLPTLFETTSAFGTVGLSMGEGGAPVSLSGHFSDAGKLLIVAMIFMGRVGPLTLAVAIARRGTPARIRYPEGKVLVG
ncbi:MAG: Trk family potassium uptake protein [Acidobacteria bacterium]|nr:Trk family potassium uptake protein [Acidobacteriota bacterium]